MRHTEYRKKRQTIANSQRKPRGKRGNEHREVHNATDKHKQTLIKMDKEHRNKQRQTDRSTKKLREKL